MTDKNHSDGGLYRKYNIERTDGKPLDKDAQYFVLRLDDDLHARMAARMYSKSVSSTNHALSIELEVMASKFSSQAELEDWNNLWKKGK